MSKRKPAEKSQLVRGIDEIPADMELASGLVAMRGLARSRTTLERLASAAEQAGQNATARELRRIHTACTDALGCIQGGFDVARLQPTMAQIADAKAEVRGTARHS